MGDSDDFYWNWNNEAVCNWIEQLGFPHKEAFEGMYA